MLLQSCERMIDCRADKSGPASGGLRPVSGKLRMSQRACAVDHRVTGIDDDGCAGFESRKHRSTLFTPAADLHGSEPGAAIDHAKRRPVVAVPEQGRRGMSNTLSSRETSIAASTL